ncbi:hypothetical protein PVAP13_9KG131700 [Panicum virgatum]|uniref:Uncharacterized protein n=1 Tax=Panicum virgatum TaxID=38727 RepID=A0A8T0NIR7_PANVG|nr:hypothetical protein PVAP13_9KG131700 [Panicum virgatum]
MSALGAVSEVPLAPPGSPPSPCAAGDLPVPPVDVSLFRPVPPRRAGDGRAGRRRHPPAIPNCWRGCGTCQGVYAPADGLIYHTNQRTKISSGGWTPSHVQCYGELNHTREVSSPISSGCCHPFGTMDGTQDGQATSSICLHYKFSRLGLVNFLCCLLLGFIWLDHG